MLSPKNNILTGCLYRKSIMYAARHFAFFWGHIEDGIRFGMFPAILVDMRTGEKVLDLGCGIGLMEQFVPSNIDLVGIDINVNALFIARQENPCFAFIQANAMRLPFKNESFGKIFLVSVLEIFEEAQRPMLVDEMYRILKPNGIILMLIANGNSRRYKRSKINVYLPQLKPLFNRFTCGTKLLGEDKSWILARAKKVAN